MKDNLNIEELFKQKFDSFQPDVSPEIWANIQTGLNAAGTSAAAGGTISAAVKVVLISGGIIAASVTTWYFGFYEPETTIPSIEEPVAVVQPMDSGDATTGETIIHVADPNDPLILENRTEIEEELRSGQSTPESVNQGSATDRGAGIVNNNPSAGGNNSAGTTTVTPVEPVSDKTTANTGGSSTDTDNDATTEDNHKEKPVPTGRMEFTQSNVYAPSVIAFVSNAKHETEVQWDFGDGTVAEGRDVKHTYAKPGKYIVTMTVIGDENAYSESQELVVRTKAAIDNIPNVITPNGDRINDYFSIETTNIETFMISIRDRNGNEVFSSNDKDFSWDGTDFGGNTVEKGLYSYIIIAEGSDGSVFKLPGQLYVQ